MIIWSFMGLQKNFRSPELLSKERFPLTASRAVHQRASSITYTSVWSCCVTLISKHVYGSKYFSWFSSIRTKIETERKNSQARLGPISGWALPRGRETSTFRKLSRSRCQSLGVWRLQGLGLEGAGHQLVTPLPPKRLPHSLVDVGPIGFALQAEEEGLEGPVLDLVRLELARRAAGLDLQLVDQSVLIATNICLKSNKISKLRTTHWRGDIRCHQGYWTTSGIFTIGQLGLFPRIPFPLNLHFHWIH